MYPFFRFIASSAGRVIRVVVGLALILVGLEVVHGITGIVIAVIGLVPFFAGLFDWCVLAPLFSLPFLGERLRQAVGHHHA